MRSTTRFVLFDYVKKLLSKKKYTRAYLSSTTSVKDNLYFLSRIFKKVHNNFSIPRLCIIFNQIFYLIICSVVISPKAKIKTSDKQDLLIYKN